MVRGDLCRFCMEISRRSISGVGRALLLQGRVGKQMCGLPSRNPAFCVERSNAGLARTKNEGLKM